MAGQTPWGTLIIAVTTAVVSMSASMIVHGAPFASVLSRDLLTLGAADGAALSPGGWWRLLSCQLLHVRPPHMLFNVLMVAVVGSGVERHLGFVRTLLLYWIAGTAGICGALFLAPSLIGSGASQALMGLVAGALVLAWRGYPMARGLMAVLALVLVVQVVLDLLHARSLKPGHAIAFVVGLALAMVVTRAAARPFQASSSEPTSRLR